MAETGLVQILEAAILAAGKPLTVANMADLFDEQDRPENTVIREALKEIGERCDDRGYELQEVASGFRFQVRQELAPWVGRLWHERPAKYSRALLETLALIAYRQPITRGEIEEIRGVAVSSNIIKTLHEREWVRVVGHRDVPGRPAMYATTRIFLDYFNLKSLEQLPALAEIRDFDTLTAELGFDNLIDETATDTEAANETPASEQQDGEQDGQQAAEQSAENGEAEHQPAAGAEAEAESTEESAEEYAAEASAETAEVVAESIDEESEEGIEQKSAADPTEVEAAPSGQAHTLSDETDYAEDADAGSELDRDHG